MKPKKLETPNCKHSVSEETENSKVQTLSFGAKVSKNSPGGGGLPICPGGAIAPCHIAGYVPELWVVFRFYNVNKFTELVAKKITSINCL